MDKKQMTEQDMRTKYINPAIIKAGWDIQKRVKEDHFFTDGRVIVRGNITTRGKRKRADYLLHHQSNFPIAIIEAKKNTFSVRAGIQQGIDYAEILDVPFAYSSNGDGFFEQDLLTGEVRELSLDEFPSPDELWERYRRAKGLSDEEEELVTEPYHFTMGDKTPRYYQMNAINRTIEAIAKGQERILLVMATGTGKTYTAFQIIYRLWKAGRAKRILFLADRNILVDQTMQNDFKPFQKVMTKVTNRTLDSSYQVYLALYHQLSGNNDMEEPFKAFTPDFFDLIVIDEAHRGSAREASRWRRILDYFSSATQIGLTATPKETETISNIAYFGEPVYTYSLKQGIEDGFLAPYKVVRLGLDRDLEGYRPVKGKLDKYGRPIEDREYKLTDFDKTMILEKRSILVAKKVTEFLKKTDRFSKTIVFCVDVDHAERMREALIRENADLVAQDSRYVMQITGDNEIGKAQLDNFIDEESLYPTIVTTSKLLTTGVDCKTVKLIVLDSHIESMSEFKQIIGRGTRLKPEYGKEFFTVMDFRNASRLFSDEAFNGPPVQIYEPGDGEDVVPPEEGDEGEQPGTEGGEGFPPDPPTPPGGEFPPGSGRQKYYVDDVEVRVLNERVMYYDKDGKLITESLKDYTKRAIQDEYATLDDFLNRWNSEERKEAIIEELKEHGVLLEALREEVGKDFDEFDLITHIAYDEKPLTRSERAKKAKTGDYLSKYSEVARQVMEALIDKYQDEGRFDFEDVKVLELNPFKELGSPIRIARYFGGKAKYRRAMRELEDNLYG